MEGNNGRVRAISFHPAILSLQGPLTVRAVFDRAWHAGDVSGTVLTVTTAPYDGPMAVRVEGLFPAAIRSGMRARIAGRVLIVGPVSVDLVGAREWNGERVDVLPVHRWALERDAERVRAPAAIEDSMLSRRVAVLEEALRRGQERDLRGAVRGLIGLGPGLTPAGDDVLCGAMAGLRVFERRLAQQGEQRAKALRYGVSPYETARRSRGLQPAVQKPVDRPSAVGPEPCIPGFDSTSKAAGGGEHQDAVLRIAESLGAVVVEQMEGRTTALSRTLLFWAARGVAVQPLLDVLWTLGSSEPVEGLETLLAIGHTSGRDMLAGAALAAASVLGGEDDAPLVRSAQHLP